MTAAMLALASPAAANLLTNGSFESGPALNGQGYYRGPNGATGWLAVAGLEYPDILSNAYVQSGGGFQSLLGAQDGVRYVDTNGASPTGGLYQDVLGLTPGAALSLSFYSWQWAQNSSGTLTASLLDAGTQAVLASTVVSYAYNPGLTSASHALTVLNGVVGASGNVRVQFVGDSGSTTRGGPALDNVVLVAAGGGVPEPASWAMLVAGFGLIGASLRWQQRARQRARQRALAA